MSTRRTLRDRLVPVVLLALVAAGAAACTSASASGPARRSTAPTATATHAARTGPGYLGDVAKLTVVPDDTVPQGCKWVKALATLECRGNAVISNMYVKGGIDSYANITISNSVVAARPTNWMLVNLRSRGGTCTVAHSTLSFANGGRLPSGFTTWGVGGINDMYACHGTYTDNDISGTPDGIDTGSDGTVIKGNYVHNLATLGVYPKNTHNDGIQLYGCSGCVITGNRFEIGWDGTHQNSCFFASDGAAGKKIVFAGNFLSGGGYAFRNIIGTGMVVTGNTFQALPKQFGLTLTGPRASFAKWAGNVTTSGTAVPAPRP